EHTDGPSKPGHPSRPGHKFRQRRLGQPSHSLLNDDQALSVECIQINRRAITCSPPSQSRSFYSFASASAGTAEFFCRGALSTPLVLPFVPFGLCRDICCSASFVLCSS